MQCRGCLIWENKRVNLVDQVLSLVSLCIRIGIEDIKLVSNLAKLLDALWRQHISLMDTECSTNNRCILLEGE